MHAQADGSSALEAKQANESPPSEGKPAEEVKKEEGEAPGAMPDLGDIGLDDFQKTLKDVFSNEEDAKEVLDSCEKMMSMLTQGMQNTPMPPMQPPSQQQQQQ